MTSAIRNALPGVMIITMLIVTGALSSAFAQGEVLQKGEGVVSFFFIRSSTDRRFDFTGARVRVIPPAGVEFRGRSETNVFSFDVAYGLTSRLEVHATVPLVQTSVKSIDAQGRALSNSEQSPRISGVGNVRFGFRYSFVSEPFFLTAKFDVKTPRDSGDLEKLFNGTTLPVEEGQTDFDITGQISKGYSLFGRGLRVGGEAGIRIRRTQKEGALDTFTREKLPVSPANEFIYSFRVGYGLLPRLSVSLIGDGIRQGDYDAPFHFTRIGPNGNLKTVGTQGSLPPGFKPDFEKQSGRRIFSLGPLASVFVTPRTVITGGVMFAVSGQNYPAGRFWILGVSRSF
jgi:hypothetical protein